MTPIHGVSDFEADPFLAVEDVARVLRSGKLTLFLGAGVSTGFGLPDWLRLVCGICNIDQASDDFHDLLRRWKAGELSDLELGKVVDEVDDGSEAYVERVRQALYEGLGTNLGARLRASPLLLAVAALITGTMRGRVEIVTTYNFDDLLEEYVEMLGYRAWVRTSATDYLERADVVINHPHGFVPRPGKWSARSTVPILSARSYRKKRAAIDKGWSAYTEQLLVQRVGLFVGLSGRDGSMLDLISRIGETWKTLRRNRGGYWLMTPSAYEESAVAVRSEGVAPLRLEREEIPEFLLNVCERAAQEEPPPDGD